jgi:SnoaL-like domain
VSAADVELARAGIEGFAAAGVAGLIERGRFDERFELVIPPEITLEPQTYVGHDGLRRYFESWYEVVDELRFEIGEARELAPGRVAVELTLIARGRASGIEVKRFGVPVYEFSDGAPVRAYVHPDLEAARAA